MISLHYTSYRVIRFRCANTIIYIQGIPGSYGYRSLEIIYIYIYIYIAHNLGFSLILIFIGGGGGNSMPPNLSVNILVGSNVYNSYL